MTLTERLNRITPKLCRLVAHKGEKPLSNQALSTATGLARSTIVKLSKLDRWDGVPLKTIQSFTEACGVDLLAPKRSMFILRHRQAAYMKNATPKQRQMFMRLLAGLNVNGNKAGATAGAVR